MNHNSKPLTIMSCNALMYMNFFGQLFSLGYTVATYLQAVANVSVGCD